MYPPTNSAHPQIQSNEDWMRNRLILLTAQDFLARGAAAMTQNAAFRAATRWLHSPEHAALARLKLGGIHRAQPFSHYFEQGTYRHFFIAEWAHLKRQDQVKAYEWMRDGRARQRDLVYRANRFGEGGEGEDGGGGFDGFGGDGGGGDDGYTVSGYPTDGEVAAPGSQGDAGFGDIGFDGEQSDGGGDANCGSGCGADTASGAEVGGGSDGGCGGGCDGGCGGGGCGGE